MNGLREPLLNVLSIYKIFVQMDSVPNLNGRIEKTIKQIESCEEHIKQGKDINDSWLKENHSILARAVKVAYKHLILTSSDNQNLKYINKFMIYYREFYRQNGIDFENLW